MIAEIAEGGELKAEGRSKTEQENAEFAQMTSSASSASSCSKFPDCKRMELRNERELENTRHKLARLESLVAADGRETGGDEELREVEIASLQRLINQLKEEIARYECV